MTFDAFRIKVQETAAALGISEYELYYMEEDSQSVSVMEGEIQEFSSDVTGGVTFRCKTGGKMGYCSTELLSAEEAERIVKAAAENAAAIETEEEGIIFAGSPRYEKTEEAAQEAGVSLRQIEGRRQAPDHPILWGVPETEYLKFYLFQIV